MTSIAENLGRVRERIAAAAERAGRDASSIKLVAVSKTCLVTAVWQAVIAGQSAFGENYVQEGIDKIEALRRLLEANHSVQSIEWHFIGPIQSNKTRAIASNFQWVHSVDRLKIAQRLNDARPDGMPPLEICIQVNISEEETKSGASVDELTALAMAIKQMPRLRLRGLMAIPRPTRDPQEQRRQFRAVRVLRDQQADRGIVLDTLSMGMTEDLEAAIAEGATMVRVGQAIFGPRPKARS
ncbi:MAG TPA: YggS family pyridoxal phosphate-dependent enzyme [Burkholderiales bacterium]|nr:YggS family pyridoxal phosphate-dependent enzyme [Burkholderiales bacterium]